MWLLAVCLNKVFHTIWSSTHKNFSWVLHSAILADWSSTKPSWQLPFSEPPKFAFSKNTAFTQFLYLYKRDHPPSDIPAFSVSPPSPFGPPSSLSCCLFIPLCFCMQGFTGSSQDSEEGSGIAAVILFMGTKGRLGSVSAEAYTALMGRVFQSPI